MLLLFSFLSYGLLSHKLGFYWDDWPYLYLNHSRGILGYPAYMSTDRPFSAWLFMLTGFLFKENPLGYHIYILILRWLCALAFFWVLNLTWPNTKAQNFIASLLLLVYPGFLQTPIAVIYSLHFSVLFLFLVSLGCMLKSIQNPVNVKWKILGIVSALSIFSCEYFAFLELVRPIILYFYLQKQKEKSTQAKRIINIWLPYLIIFFTFLVWRIFIFKFPTYEPIMFQESSTSLINYLFQLAKRVFSDFFTVIFAAWGNIFSSSRFFFQSNSYYKYWIFLSIIASSLSWASLKNLLKKSDPSSKSTTNWQIHFIILGIVALILAGIPIWATNLPVQLVFAWDRLTIPFSMGVSLLLTAVLDKLIKHKIIKIFVISIIIGFSVGHHFLNTTSYINEWEMVNDFFWQMHYRIPTLKKGTTLLTDNFPLTYYSDNSLTAPLNWMYDENNQGEELKYMFYFLDVRLGTRLPALKPDLVIEQPFRSFSFTGSSSDILVIFYSPPSCLHIIDPVVDFYNPKFSGVFKEAFGLSNFDLITTESTNMPKIFINQESASWCYYYQKADLARQYKDWHSILGIANLVFKSDLKPADMVEYFPFIEAYANTNQWDYALELSQKVHFTDSTNDPMLCSLWQRILQSNPMKAAPQFILDLFFSTYKCAEIL